MRLSPAGHQPSISWSGGIIIITIIIIIIIIIVIIVVAITIISIIFITIIMMLVGFLIKSSLLFLWGKVKVYVCLLQFLHVS